MIIQAELRRKQSEYEGEACSVDKVIELPAQRFKQFSRALLADYDFIAENKNAIRHDDDARHCLLILDAEGKDGFLVDPQGYNYARYSAFVPNARSLLTPDMGIDRSYLSPAEPWRNENQDEMLRMTLRVDGKPDYTLVLPADEEYLDAVKAYVKVTPPSVVYHLTRMENLDSILDDGQIRRFLDSECWFCESLPKMKAYMEQTVMCEGKPYYAVGGQLCRYPKFVPEDYVLLKLTPCGYEDNWYRWNQEIPPGSPKELVQAAKEFSGLKIGYRGDLTFRNAEVIDVALFLTEEIVQGESVQTTSELQELLFEHIEREQREYTDSLYRMTQGQLIANAGEIEATRICYNALLTAVFEREQLILLLSNDKPLTSVREAWQAEQAENYDMEFSHTILRFCEDIRQAQQPEMTM